MTARICTLTAGTFSGILINASKKAFAPELVREDKITDEMGVEPATYAKYPIVEGMVPASGVLAPAVSSSAEKGKLMTNEAISAFIEIADRNF